MPQVTANGVQLYYEIAGDDGKPVILFLHRCDAPGHAVHNRRFHTPHGYDAHHAYTPGSGSEAPQTGGLSPHSGKHESWLLRTAAGQDEFKPDTIARGVETAHKVGQEDTNILRSF